MTGLSVDQGPRALGPRERPDSSGVVLTGEPDLRRGSRPAAAGPAAARPIGGDGGIGSQLGTAAAAEVPRGGSSRSGRMCRRADASRMSDIGQMALGRRRGILGRLGVSLGTAARTAAGGRHG